MNILNTLSHAPWVSQTCAFVLLVLVAAFFGHFVLKCFRRRATLLKLVNGLKTLRKDESPDALFGKAGDLEHLWKEFGETLLDETEFNSITGQYDLKAKRASMPSEQFFSQHAVVDSFVWTEFYKHLPGILTGIGIIGTFFGVLHGLQAFNISDNAALVRTSLSNLLGSVSEAFLVSAFAIFFAMVITFVEKLLLARLYKQAETLTAEIDRRYVAGAGEAMLQELVHSTNRYVTNSETLKDALVSDLKGILVSLSESQIAAQEKIVEALKANEKSTSSLGEKIGDHIAKGVSEAVAEPMAALKKAVETATGTQTTAVGTLLTDTIIALKDSLRDLFGEQLTGINEMQQKTIETLQGAVARMEHLTQSLETTGARTTETMAGAIAKAIEGMDARQDLMARKMSEVVDEMKKTSEGAQTAVNEKLESAISGLSCKMTDLVAKLTESVSASTDSTNQKLGAALNGVSQTVETLVSTLSQLVAKSQDATNEKLTKAVGDVSANVEKLVNGLSQSVVNAQEKSNATLEGAVSTVNDKVGGFLRGITEQAARAEAENIERQKWLSEQAEANATAMRAALEGTTTEMKALVAGTRAAVDTMRQSVDSMRNATSDTVAKMNSGAETMFGAANEFSKAGSSLSGVLQQSEATTAKLAIAAGSVETAAQAMRRVVDDYSTTRDQLLQTVIEARKIVDDAKNNSLSSGKVLAEIRDATDALSAAHTEIDSFMTKVAEVMGKSTLAFQAELKESIITANRGLVDTTAEVTSLLARSIARLANATRPVLAERVQ
ncbi:Apolipoprotein A1/A4/E domain protein [Caballeronia calidae]|uniref:Apolipoprotein A1/A4/E domain protein n=1 Tax=Caballeronia calidae TaxID=1777139 RepID=A0A158B952_9BURK|nr:anti-phage ZorAB system protein ZorA [Caballeronia calidae]SAK66605.1 Apolipoprotein A1/A4/E domain protein [Caballeronia calidae]